MHRQAMLGNVAGEEGGIELVLAVLTARAAGRLRPSAGDGDGCSQASGRVHPGHHAQSRLAHGVASLTSLYFTMSRLILPCYALSYLVTPYLTMSLGAAVPLRFVQCHHVRAALPGRSGQWLGPSAVVRTCETLLLTLRRPLAVVAIGCCCDWLLFRLAVVAIGCCCDWLLL